MAQAERDPREEVLDYLARLDDALEPSMRPGERKLVRRDVKHLVEDLSFRFAFLDDRLAPADVDIARALEARKPPSRAAPVVLAHRAGYRRRARAGAVRSVAALLLVLGIAAGVWALAGSEEAAFLGEYAEGRAVPTTESDSTVVAVPEGLDRVYLVVQPLVRSDGTLTVTVLGPKSEVLYQRTFVRGDVAFDDRNLEALPGEWAVVVDYRDVAANVRVKLTGVRAT